MATKKSICINILRKWLMMILTIIGIICGFGLGFLVRIAEPSEDTIMWIGMPGEIFLNLLMMPVIPLVFCSVLLASATMDPKKNGKLGLIFILLHVGTNFFGSAMGLFLALLIKPGQGIGEVKESIQIETLMKPTDIAADMVRNIFPNNLVRATFQKVVTKYDKTEAHVTINDSGILNTTVSYGVKKSIAYADTTNVLGILLCCVIIGLATGKVKEKGKPLLDFCQSVFDVIIVLLQWLLWIAPIGIASLIAASIAAIDDITSMMIKLSLLVVAVLLGLFIHQVIVVPLLYVILTRKNPFKLHLLNLKTWFVGFAASSSASAMPYFYETCNKLNMHKHVSSVGVPIAVTLNATGSSLFICCAMIFLAQVNQIVLNSGQIFILFVMTSLSTMALPAAPSASIILIIILCTTFGIPVESIGLLYAVEWLMDRIRTTSNIVSEIFIIVIAWHFVKKDFKLNDINDVVIEDKIPKKDDVELGNGLSSASTFL